MSIHTQKRLLQILVPVAILAPPLWGTSAWWTHSISSFEATGIGIAVVGILLLLILSVPLLYLGQRGGPESHPNRWEKEPRTLLFVLIFFIYGLIFLSVLIAILWVRNIWRMNTDMATIIAIADLLMMIGLLLITETFTILHLLQKRNKA